GSVSRKPPRAPICRKLRRETAWQLRVRAGKRLSMEAPVHAGGGGQDQQEQTGVGTDCAQAKARRIQHRLSYPIGRADCNCFLKVGLLAEECACQMPAEPSQTLIKPPAASR